MQSKDEASFVERSAFSRYSLAFIAVAVAFLFKTLLSPLIEQDTPFLVVLAAVMVAAWFGGLGPGLLATFVTAPLVDYFFLPPLNSFSGLSLQSVPLVVFMLEGALISSLAAALRSSRSRAEISVLELRRSEERFRLLVEGVRDYAIFLLDPDGRVASWNVGVERIYGYRKEEIVGEHFSRFYTQEDREHGHPEEELRTAATEGRYEEEGLRVRKDGSLFWANVLTTTLTDEAGTLRGFSKVTRDITERKRNEQNLRAALARLQASEHRLHELVGKVLVAQEEERRRVARDIHDGLAHLVVAAHTHLDAFAMGYPLDARDRQELDRARELIGETVKEARHVIADLRPAALDDFGLAAALRLQIERFCNDGGCEAGYEETLGEERLPVAVETALFRVAQEALTNIRKHAQSSRMHLKLERLERAIRLEVRDWGRGFEPDETTNSDGRGMRVGLASMQERIALLGGDLKIDSRPEAGTTIVAEVPLTEENAYRER